jgi:hypothetical protein
LNKNYRKNRARCVKLANRQAECLSLLSFIRAPHPTYF